MQLATCLLHKKVSLVRHVIITIEHIFFKLDGLLDQLGKQTIEYNHHKVRSYHP